MPPCSECTSAYTYEMGALLVCPECGHEWSFETAEATGETVPRVIKDAVLMDGVGPMQLKSAVVKKV